MTEPRRFTTEPPVDFWIDDDQFWVLGAIPAEELAALMDLQQGLSGEGVGLQQQYEGIKQVLAFTMIPESWDRFLARLSDRSRPIDFKLLLKITNMLSGDIWAGKEDGQSPPPSTDTPAPDGTTSTDGAPPEDSTPTDAGTVEISVVPAT